MALVCHTWLPWYSKSEELFQHVSDLHECSTCFWEFADLTQHKKRCQPSEEELDTHVWHIHQLKKVKYIFWGFLGCVLGGILEGALGVILVGALGIIFGADFFAREEDLNQHQRKFIPGWSNPGWSDSMHSTSPEWKPKKTKKERKKQNRKRVWKRK